MRGIFETVHPQAYGFVARVVDGFDLWRSEDVLDIGGRNINGSCRDLFFSVAGYRALDLYPGPGVDIVADAAAWAPDRVFDVVLSTEVFEHTPDWPGIVATMARALDPRGVAVMTMATDPRAPHSAIDENPIRPEEFYRNVGPDELREVLSDTFSEVFIETSNPGDLYAWAKP